MRPAAHCASHAALAFTLLVATMAARSACAQAAPASDLLYLEVSVNGRPSGLIMPFSGANGSLRTSASNLRQLGLADAALGQAEVEGEIALDRLAGLRYTLDVASQSVALHVDDALRAPFLAAARATRVSAPASASPGAVLNYDLASQLGATRATMWTGELRLFNATSAFSTSGTLLAGPGLRQALRYDSYWQWSD
ncbi:MAG: hypothetical protein Q7T55_14715, partial [Solirubrobacteraceae bacterium]|nr:hypothetical protein [Solirubrobacteraceae bacterium]